MPLALGAETFEILYFVPGAIEFPPAAPIQGMEHWKGKLFDFSA